MSRVISYVDGFNFYFGLREKGWRKYYWLDFAAVTRSLLKPTQQFQHCHYFTAQMRQGPKNRNNSRQTIWLEALDTRSDISCHLGHYLPKKQICKNCKTTWTKHEEKMTDVNIATQLLIDAFEDKYDTAIVMSGDSDLSTPIKKVKSKFDKKQIIVAFPPARHSEQLKKVAHGHLVIGQDKLRQNLLPNRITTSSGFVICRPQEWY